MVGKKKKGILLAFLTLILSMEGGEESCPLPLQALPPLKGLPD